MIYWVAVVERPTKKQAEEQNALEKLILEPTTIVARDEKDAALKVALNNPKLKATNLDRIEVLVRPF